LEYSESSNDAGEPKYTTPPPSSAEPAVATETAPGEVAAGKIAQEKAVATKVPEFIAPPPRPVDPAVVEEEDSEEEDLEERESDRYRDEVKDPVMRLIFAAIRIIGEGAFQQATTMATDYLVEHPDAINQKYGKHGLTLLHAAASAGNIELVKLLIERGANLNIKTNTGFSPLYGALRNGCVSVVRFLISKGASCVEEFNSPFGLLKDIVRRKKCSSLAKKIFSHFRKKPCINPSGTFLPAIDGAFDDDSDGEAGEGAEDSESSEDGSTGVDDSEESEC
jgi:hypothetical protein